MFAGFSTVRELAPDREWTDRAGWQTLRRFEGTEGELLAVAAAFQAPGVHLNLRPNDPPFFTLEVRLDNAQDGTEEDAEENVQIQWSLKPNQLEKDVFASKAWHALGVDVYSPYYSEDDSDEIQKWRDEPNKDNKPTPQSAIGQAMYAALQNGVESFYVIQYTLRRTITVPAGWPGVAATQYEGYQFSAAQLLALEQIPTDLIFRIDTIGGWWLRLAADIDVTIGGKRQIIQEWMHADEWAEIFYPKFTP